jgi:hypothetical protein
MPRPPQRSSVTRSAEGAALLIALLATRTPTADAQRGVEQQSATIPATIRTQPVCVPAHDVIDVSQRCGMPEVVYPVIVSLIDKRTVPELTARGPCAMPDSLRP